ncbi:hypothetical protein C9374_011516 [Naegleria lovaniensis]|uniref:Uncharacterized protein n=1 Tax=Naegleria lovaniensis TaxID=51637 RepID=A0AA88H2N5_NAELO|nr:uncharacterized protein C9374_011516 [Naegleria lovaniensis]KAG2392791.1 hypothetical protein C9374_011516 [Naegleria lovaniensis]
MGSSLSKKQKQEIGSNYAGYTSLELYSNSKSMNVSPKKFMVSSSETSALASHHHHGATTGFHVERICVTGLIGSGKTFLINKIMEYLTIPNFSDFKQHMQHEKKKLEFIEIEKDIIAKTRTIGGTQIKGLIYVIHRKEYLTLHHSLNELLRIVQHNASLHSIPIVVVGLHILGVAPLLADNYKCKTIMEEDFDAATQHLFSLLHQHFNNRCFYLDFIVSEDVEHDRQMISSNIEYILMSLTSSPHSTTLSNESMTKKYEDFRQQHDGDFQNYVQSISEKSTPNTLPASPSNVFV